MDSNEKWFAVKEVGARLGVSRDSVSRWIARGQLRAMRLPSQTSKRHRDYVSYRISESDLQRFEREHMTK